MDHQNVAPAEASAPKPLSLSERVRLLRLPEETRRSTQARPWLPWTLTVLFGLSTGYLGYREWVGLSVRGVAGGGKGIAASGAGSGEKSVTRPTANSGSSEASASATATAPTSSPGGVVLESKGYIVPAHQILVSPKISGMIVTLSIEEGRRVKKGEILAEIEKTDYQADVDRAQANLAAARERLGELTAGYRPEEIEQAKAELAEAEAQRAQLEAEFTRNQRLRDSRSLAAREFEQAESAFKAMDRRVARLRNAYQLIVEGPRKERIQAAKNDVQQFEAELSKAKWRLDNCTIRSPISGTILKKNAEEGNIVNPVAFNGSFSLCDMADLSDLEVDLSIQERDIARVHKGQSVRVRADAWPDRVYDGVVDRIMPIADRAKGAVPVRVKVRVPSAEEGVYLKPEMGVLASFLSAPPKTADKPADKTSGPVSTSPQAK